MTLHPTQNISVTGLVYKTGSSTNMITNVMCASATYQNGKVIAIGDSSIPDDGTGDIGDTLYNGYIADASGNHQRLLMNAIIWLATTSPLSIESSSFLNNSFVIAPNPILNKELKFNYLNPENELTKIEIFDALGRTVKIALLLNSENSIALNELNSGVYLCKISNANHSKSMRFVIN